MTTPQNTIVNKTVLVTGANRGVGRALVDEALRRGAKRVYAGTRQPLAHPDGRVTGLILDVTDGAHIREAAESIDTLDVLVNNAGLAVYDDLGDRAVLERHLAVNLFGPYTITQALLPQLTRSRGAVVNVLSLAALGSLPVVPAYSISKAAAFSLTQSLRALFAPRGVRVHAVLSGPVDTEMSRDFDVPKAAPASVAQAIFDGVAGGEEEIFPDPMSALLAPGWSAGAVKALERENTALLGSAPATTTHGTGDVMNDDSLTIAFTVDRTPDQVFAAITDVRGWWSGEIDGPTDELGGEFTYRYQDVHRSTQRITELIPGKRVAWHVVDGYLSFVEDATEWTGTDITFDLVPAGGHGTEVRFTHVGLAPHAECFESCSSAWRFYIATSLRSLINEGPGRPDPKAGGAS